MTLATRKWTNLQKRYVMVSVEVDLVVLNFALPLLNLLDMLTVYNIYSIQVLKLPTSGTKFYYLMYLATPFSMLAKCIATTKKIYISHV